MPKSVQSFSGLLFIGWFIIGVTLGFCIDMLWFGIGLGVAFLNVGLTEFICTVILVKSNVEATQSVIESFIKQGKEKSKDGN